MIALLCFFLTLLVSPFKSKSRLEAENVALRRQLIILRRKVRGRVHLTNGDRLFLVLGGYRTAALHLRYSRRRRRCERVVGRAWRHASRDPGTRLGPSCISSAPQLKRE